MLAEENINSLVGIAGFNRERTTGVIVVGHNSIPLIPWIVTGPLSASYLKVRPKTDTENGNPWSFVMLKDYNLRHEYAPVETSHSAPKYY